MAVILVKVKVILEKDTVISAQATVIYITCYLFRVIYTKFAARMEVCDESFTTGRNER
jgi:hypothetical protein